MQRFLVPSGVLRLAVCLAFAVPSFGALSAYVVFEVRPGAGADANGAGYDQSVMSPGTDWSQQNAAHVTFNGSTITATTAAASATIVITGYTVAATDPGNMLQISGGINFTTGFYTIVSVSVGSSTWTLDRAVTTGAGTAMTGSMGGAAATLAPLFVSSSSQVPVGGNIVWIKGGTLTVTAGIFIQGTFTYANHISVRGYTTTRGDGGKATITTPTNSINLINVTATGGALGGQELENLILTSTAVTPGYGVYAANGNVDWVTIQNCVLSGFLNGIDGSNPEAFIIENLTVLGSEIKSNTTYGITSQGSVTVIGSYIHNNGSDGLHIVLANAAAATGIASTFANNGSNGAYAGGGFYQPVQFYGCVFYGNTVNGLLSVYNDAAGLTAVNNIAYGNGGFGFNTTNSVPSFPSAYLAGLILTNNAVGANTNGPWGGGLQASYATGTVSLSANPFTSPSTGNYALNTGGTTALLNNGYPGVTPFGTGYATPGALQPMGGSSASQHGYPIVQ
jgi:hypothetical protein